MGNRFIVIANIHRNLLDFRGKTPNKNRRDDLKIPHFVTTRQN